MPMIIVEGPRIQDVERKRRLVKKLTEVAMDVYNIEHITVLIRENLPENIGVNGQLVCDMKK
jgi:4-oxalocrotonate tautomerase